MFSKRLGHGPFGPPGYFYGKRFWKNTFESPGCVTFISTILTVTDYR